MFLLPWEKLPSWLTGPLALLFGIYTFFHAEADPEQQVIGALIAIVGLALAIHGARTLLKDGEEDDHHVPTNSKQFQNKAGMAATPDYNKYNETQLTQILGRINAERYPDRVEAIKARLKELSLTGKPVD